MPKVIKKTQFAGAGAAVQLMGVALAVVGALYFGDTGLVVGGVAGLLLLVIGSNMSKAFLCSECRNPVASKAVRLCPACKAEFH